MRELIVTTLLAGILIPAAVSAEQMPIQADGGAPDGSSYTQAQPTQGPGPMGPNNMGPPTGRSGDPNGNMGNVGRTGRNPRYDVPTVIADGAVIPDGGAPDGPPSAGSGAAPSESGAQGTTGNKWGVKPQQNPDRSASPASEAPSSSGGPKSE